MSARFDFNFFSSSNIFSLISKLLHLQCFLPEMCPQPYISPHNLLLVQLSDQMFFLCTGPLPEFLLLNADSDLTLLVQGMRSWIFFPQRGFYFLAVPYSMWDLNSPNRNWTCAPCSEMWSLNHLTSGKVLTGPNFAFLTSSIVTAMLLF